jgi:hypothetical protein
MIFLLHQSHSYAINKKATKKLNHFTINFMIVSVKITMDVSTIKIVIHFDKYHHHGANITTNQCSNEKCLLFNLNSNRLAIQHCRFHF